MQVNLEANVKMVPKKCAWVIEALRMQRAVAEPSAYYLPAKELRLILAAARNYFRPGKYTEIEIMYYGIPIKEYVS